MRHEQVAEYVAGLWSASDGSRAVAYYAALMAAQAIEAFGQDAKRLDGEATKARSRKGCAQGRD